MSIIQPIKKGFGVAAGSMSLVFLLFAVGVVWNLINLFLTGKVQTPNPTTQQSIVMAAVGLAFILVSFFVQGGSMGYVLDKVKTGKAGLGGFFAAGQKFYGKLFILGLLVSLVIVAFVLVAALPVIFLNGKMDVLGVAIAVIVSGIGIYFILLIFFAPYLIIASGEKVVASLKQSIALVRKNLLTVIGTTLLLVAIGFVIGILLGLALAGLDAVVKGVPGQVIFAVISSLVNAFLGVVVTGSFMTLYLNLSNSNNTAGAN